MFSTKEKLEKRTGQHGINRLEFLTQLVNEYEKTDSKSSKEQVIANLANFSYDPINFDYLRRLKVIDLFLNALSDSNKKIVKFAIGGICNLCLEPFIKQYVLRIDGLSLIYPLIDYEEENIVLSSITTVYYLLTPNEAKNIPQNVLERVKELSTSTNIRFKNLATLFLEKFPKCDSYPQK